MQSYVFSRTLRKADCPDATVSDAAVDTVAALKAKPGKDIWLFGGGSLFRSLKHGVFEKTGTVWLEYACGPGKGA